MKVLVGVITSDVKDYCWKDFSEQLKKLNLDVYVVDNSVGHGYRHKISKDFECDHVSPKGMDIRLAMAKSSEMIRKKFLEEDYTHILWIESDIFLNDFMPLFLHNKDIVGVPYFINQGGKSHLCVEKLSPLINENQMAYLLKDDIDFSFMNGSVRRVFSVGLGCVLISRRVLEKVKFRWRQGEVGHHDTFFSYDCFRAGFQTWCDTSLLAEHRNKDYWK